MTRGKLFGKAGVKIINIYIGLKLSHFETFNLASYNLMRHRLLFYPLYVMLKFLSKFVSESYAIYPILGTPDHKQN